MVGLGAPGAVDPECRGSSAAVAEAARDGTHGDAGGDQLCGGVVPQLMEVHVPAEAGAHAAVPQGRRARPARATAVWVAGEDVRLLCEALAELRNLLLGAIAVCL